jgi:hypothetical protein
MSVSNLSLISAVILFGVPDVLPIEFNIFGLWI